MALLLVEDNAKLSASLTRGLREDGFEVEPVSTGAAARARLASRDVDAVILDLGLPDLDGLAVLEEARRNGLVAPVLVLTARDALESRVAGLECGADDYLVKPFAYAELLARIRSLIRRAARPRWAPLRAGNLALAPGEPAVVIRGNPVALSPREHALLELFVRRRGEVLVRAEILREVFGYSFDPGTNLVDVHVANLRRKLGDQADRIETVRGAGYRFRGGPDE